MSTPTPTSASKKPTGTTPSHPLPTNTSIAAMNYSSPAAPARSNPSPNAVRTSQQAGKTPINHATGSSQGSKTLGGTPMMASLSQQGLTVGSSPGAGTLAGGSFGTPIGIGLEGIGTPSLGGGGLGGVAMMPTMSELGLSGSGSIGGSGSVKRDEDEERRAKMRRVLKRIGRRTGRVSEEGIVRVSRRVGFETNLDDEKEAPALHVLGNRTFTIAGKKILVDVAMAAQKARTVEFVFASENQFLAKVQGPAVGRVLLRDLGEQEVEGGWSLAPTLDRFAANLERLARLDRLNSDHLDCFEALSGLHASLERLFEEEKKLGTEWEVMCEKSGRPELHARGELGLSLAYWQDPMLRALKHEQPLDAALTDPDDGIYRLRLEVEPSAAALYPPLRNSDSWLPDPLMLPMADSGVIPWQEPPPTLIPPGPDPMALDGGQDKPPDLRFVARLDPPLIMEHFTALNLLTSLGIVTPAPTTIPPLYHVMLLDSSSHSTPSQTTTTTTTTTSPSSAPRLPRSPLTASKPCTTTPSMLASKSSPTPLPSSHSPHPRQLIEALPVLRQWATLTTLLRSAFPAAYISTPSAASSQPQPRHPANPLTPPTTPPSDPANVLVHVSVTTTPLPTFSITYPCPTHNSTDENDGDDGDDEHLVTKLLQVGLNGTLSIVTHARQVGDDTFVNTQPSLSGESKQQQEDVSMPDAEQETQQRAVEDVQKDDRTARDQVARTQQGQEQRDALAARALRECADLGVWIEWLRGKGW